MKKWNGWGLVEAVGAYVMNTYVPLQNNTGTPG